MTTTQAPPNGHRVSPPPFPVENPAAPTGADLPTDKANTIQDQLATDDQVVERQKGVSSRESLRRERHGIQELRGATESDQELSRVTKSTPLLAHEKVAPEQPPFPASAYHVPPKLFAPKADSFRNTIPQGWGRTKLPDRCQFMFSDGRQCTMARSDIHPSLCVYHSDREEQLFGDPGQRCEAKTLDFPELHSACRDLSTASGVNRALAQVFRMLARGRMSRQEAATFAKLAHLLLQTISAMRAEDLNDDEQHMSPVVERQKGVSSRESLRRERHGNQELRGATESHQELSRVTKSTPLLPHNEVVPSESGAPDARRLCAGWGGETGAPDARRLCARWGGETGAPDARCPGAERHATKKIARWGGQAVAAAPDSEEVQPVEPNSRTINTCANRTSNPPKINTYEIAGLNPLQNQHLQNKRSACIEPNGSSSSL